MTQVLQQTTRVEEGTQHRSIKRRSVSVVRAGACGSDGARAYASDAGSVGSVDAERADLGGIGHTAMREAGAVPPRLYRSGSSGLRAYDSDAGGGMGRAVGCGGPWDRAAEPGAAAAGGSGSSCSKSPPTGRRARAIFSLRRSDRGGGSGARSGAGGVSSSCPGAMPAQPLSLPLPTVTALSHSSMSTAARGAGAAGLGPRAEGGPPAAVDDEAAAGLQWCRPDAGSDGLVGSLLHAAVGPSLPHGTAGPSLLHGMARHACQASDGGLPISAVLDSGGRVTGCTDACGGVDAGDGVDARPAFRISTVLATGHDGAGGDACEGTALAFRIVTVLDGRDEGAACQEACDPARCGGEGPALLERACGGGGDAGGLAKAAFDDECRAGTAEKQAAAAEEHSPSCPAGPLACGGGAGSADDGMEGLAVRVVLTEEDFQTPLQSPTCSGNACDAATTCTRARQQLQQQQYPGLRNNGRSGSPPRVPGTCGGRGGAGCIPPEALTTVGEFNAALAEAAAAGHRGRADALWRALLCSALLPDQHTLNLLLRCMANSLARPDEAECLAREVCAVGDLSPNATTYNLLAETRFRYEQLCSL